jgi:hypothetical protein
MSLTYHKLLGKRSRWITLNSIVSPLSGLLALLVGGHRIGGIRKLPDRDYVAKNFWVRLCYKSHSNFWGIPGSSLFHITIILFLQLQNPIPKPKKKKRKPFKSPRNIWRSEVSLSHTAHNFFRQMLEYLSHFHISH